MNSPDHGRTWKRWSDAAVGYNPSATAGAHTQARTGAAKQPPHTKSKQSSRRGTGGGTVPRALSPGESRVDTLSTASLQALSPLSQTTDTALVTTGWISPIPKTKAMARRGHSGSSGGGNDDAGAGAAAPRRRSSAGSAGSSSTTNAGTQAVFAGEASSLARRRRRDAAALDIQRMWRGFCARARVQRMLVVRRLSHPRGTGPITLPSSSLSSSNRRTSMELRVANGVTYVSNTIGAFESAASRPYGLPSTGFDATSRPSGSTRPATAHPRTSAATDSGRGRRPSQQQQQQQQATDVVVNRLYKPSTRLYHENAVEYATGTVQTAAQGFPFLRRRSAEFTDPHSGRVMRSQDFAR